MAGNIFLHVLMGHLLGVRGLTLIGLMNWSVQKQAGLKSVWIRGLQGAGRHNKPANWQVLDTTMPTGIQIELLRLSLCRQFCTSSKKITTLMETVMFLQKYTVYEWVPKHCDGYFVNENANSLTVEFSFSDNIVTKLVWYLIQTKRPWIVKWKYICMLFYIKIKKISL